MNFIRLINVMYVQNYYNNKCEMIYERNRLIFIINAEIIAK
jgi:hypothetical protein